MSIAVWFIPTPKAVTTPSVRSRCSAGYAFAGHLLPDVVRVVHQRQVDTLEPEAVEAVRQRVFDTGRAVVQHLPVRRRTKERVGPVDPVRVGDVQTAGLS